MAKTQADITEPEDNLFQKAFQKSRQRAKHTLDGA